MNAALVKWELRKLWSLPMTPVFLALCLALDLSVAGLTWYEQRDAADAVGYIADVSEQAGTRMGPALDAALTSLPADSRRDALAAAVKDAEDVYEDLDAAALGEEFLRMYQMTGPAAERVRVKFARFQSAVDELAAQDAALDMAAASVTPELYSHLLIDLVRLVTGEGILFAMLLALYAAGSERVTRTVQTVYASRTGRRVQWSKYAASLLSALGSYTLLCLITVGAFALLWPLGPIWGESVSTQFYRLSLFGYFLTWRPFTLAGYLAAELALGLGLTAVFHGLAAAAGVLSGDMYRGFLALAVMLTATVAGGQAAANAGLWGLYQAGFFLPTWLWLDVGQWFTHSRTDTLFRGQELAVLTLWLTLAGLLFFAAWRRFSRKDVV